MFGWVSIHCNESVIIERWMQIQEIRVPYPNPLQKELSHALTPEALGLDNEPGMDFRFHLEPDEMHLAKYTSDVICIRTILKEIH